VLHVPRQVVLGHAEPGFLEHPRVSTENESLRTMAKRNGSATSALAERVRSAPARLAAVEELETLPSSFIVSSGLKGRSWCGTSIQGIGREHGRGCSVDVSAGAPQTNRRCQRKWGESPTTNALPSVGQDQRGGFHALVA
jgi:hypothetical protein